MARGVWTLWDKVCPDPPAFPCVLRPLLPPHGLRPCMSSVNSTFLQNLWVLVMASSNSPSGTFPLCALRHIVLLLFFEAGSCCVAQDGFERVQSSSYLCLPSSRIMSVQHRVLFLSFFLFFVVVVLFSETGLLCVA